MWEVSWRRRETATYWPQVPLTIAGLLSHSAGLLNRGLEGPSPLSGAGSHSPGILSPIATGTLTRTAWNWLSVCLELRLTQAVCGTWLYNCLTPTCFLWAYASAPNSTTSTGQGDIPISSTGCTCFLIDDSVEGQYVTEFELAYFETTVQHFRCYTRGIPVWFSLIFLFNGISTFMGY